MGIKTEKPIIQPNNMADRKGECIKLITVEITVQRKLNKSQMGIKQGFASI